MDHILLKRRKIIIKVFPEVWDYFDLYKKEFERVFGSYKIIFDVRVSSSIAVSNKHQIMRFTFLASDHFYRTLIGVTKESFEFEKNKLEIEEL